MTKEQLKDIETIRYFIPDCMKHIEITDQDVKDFLDLSERGLNKDKVGTYTMDGFNALVQGKRWRGIHVEMFEEGNLDGSFPYWELATCYPVSVVEFMAGEMFKGVDKNRIIGLLEIAKEMDRPKTWWQKIISFFT